MTPRPVSARPPAARSAQKPCPSPTAATGPPPTQTRTTQAPSTNSNPTTITSSAHQALMMARNIDQVNDPRPRLVRARVQQARCFSGGDQLVRQALGGWRRGFCILATTGARTRHRSAPAPAPALPFSASPIRNTRPPPPTTSHQQFCRASHRAPLVSNSSSAESSKVSLDLAARKHYAAQARGAGRRSCAKGGRGVGRTRANRDRGVRMVLGVCSAGFVLNTYCWWKNNGA